MINLIILTPKSDVYKRQLQSSTFRQLQLYLKIALVFYRQEAGRHQPVDNENGNQYQACLLYTSSVYITFAVWKQRYAEIDLFFKIFFCI